MVVTNFSTGIFDLRVILSTYLFIFICSLFQDAVSTSDYVASNDRMTGEWRIGSISKEEVLF
jgi:hypothetical protein